MDKQQVVYEKITECMKTIFTFCISRTSSREEAEDLSQEIVKEVLKSANSLRDEEAFYGWMWAIANNVYKGYLRRRKKIEHYGIDENLVDNLCKMPETVVVQNDELNILKRELSLLSEHHRKATILYYIDNKSCNHISQELEISLEMVKYLLFKSRKILREGMNMSREFGEKSYNPGVFNVDVWMDETEHKLYYELFDRKLPGNILLAAYYNSMTITQMSVELGVAAPYLEDEIKILMKHNLIKQLHNARYQTNIIIFTQSCEDDIYIKTKDIYPSVADELFQFMQKNEDKIREINFIGSDCNKNRLYWLATHIALLSGLFQAKEEEFEGVEGFPMLSNGTHGYIWGNNNPSGNHLFNGLYGTCEVKPDSDWVNICNFKIIEKCQEFHPEDAKLDMLIKAARHDIKEDNNEVLAELISEGYIINNNREYSVNFPVLTECQYHTFVDLMEPAIKIIKENIKLAASESTKVVQNHAPSQLLDICAAVSQLKYKVDSLGYIVEQMCTKGYLIVPNCPEKLGMYAVLK
jgi:RNA polymerase sigma factor (sigma-70 family)